MSLFAFPLFSSLIHEAEKHREPLSAEILGLQSKFPGAKRSNRNAWHSADEFLQSKNPHVGWVLNNALTFAKKTLGRYYQDWAHHEVRLGHYWANVVGKEGWNAPHHHFPTHWSGVYYISVGQVGTGGDDMGGMIEFLNPTPWQATWNRSGNFALAPKDGLMLLFPASLLHFVYPHTGDAPRISMAYNFTVYPKS
jgi:uncharacterized protein (TIGR02466 family)